MKTPARVLVDVVHPKGGRFRKPLLDWSLQFLGVLKQYDAELSVSLVTDRAIRKLNAQWRKKDKPTDVLSFPGGEPLGGGPRILGDVVISLDTAVRQAKAHRTPLKDELARYLAHGVLHLLGHDHHRKADAAKMAALEEKLLGAPGMLSGGA